jgi:hypothetical protein
VQICKETCDDPADVCAGEHSVLFFIEGTNEIVDPTDKGCKIECLPQEQDCTSTCEYPKVSATALHELLYALQGYLLTCIRSLQLS